MTTLPAVIKNNPVSMQIPGRLPFNLAQIRPFLPMLSGRDRTGFNDLVTYTSDRTVEIDKRTEILPLKDPIDIGGQTISAIRAKGCFPQIDENGDVIPYADQGLEKSFFGFPRVRTDLLFRILAEKGYISVSTITGRMVANKDVLKQNEAKLARDLGSAFSDYEKAGILDILMAGSSLKGFLQKSVKSAGNHAIHGMPTTPDELSPRGAMDQVSMQKELGAADALGPVCTDMLLGYGFFDRMVFAGYSVGTILYGMTGTEDERLNLLFRAVVPFSGKNDEFERERMNGRFSALEKSAERTGELLRTVHEKMVCHMDSHLGNYRPAPDGSQKIVDLESSVMMSGMSENDISPLIYIDLSGLIRRYMDMWVLRKSYGLDGAFLVPHFLNGYFKSDKTLDFLRNIRPFVETRRSNSELHSVFGYIPVKAKGGYRTGNGAMFSLAEARLRALFEDAGRVDLLSLCDENDIFAQFYGAIRQVAKGISGKPGNRQEGQK